MKSKLLLLAMVLLLGTPATYAASSSAKTSKSDVVTVSEGVLTIPTYQSPGRYLQPPLFPHSTLSGLYPFTTYEMPFKEGGPVPEKYPAVFVENEYLKLTYIPELGGRFFSLYDKLHHRQVFYRNDVIKPAHYNDRVNFPLSGIELTGPYDSHSLTTHSEPYWSHTIVKHKDGSVTVVLGELDPIYHMNVTFSATLYPGVAALKTDVFCYNGTDGQKPQMFWTSASLQSTPKTRFLYPMTETVGHTTGVVSPWPIYNGEDLSWDRNNKNMLGVFGIDSYDNYGGVYKFDEDYGMFRYADRRVVQGMKLWTFGYGKTATALEHAYTDTAGPYIEAQSGRYVWDGHYEWVYPHTVERWHEWWIPVAGINGLTTLTQDVALNLEVHPDPAGTNSSVDVALSPVRPIHNAKLIVTAKTGELLNASIDLIPGTAVKKTIFRIHADAAGLEDMHVSIIGPDGSVLMDYHRPDSAPGGDVTPFAKDLQNAPIPLEKMTAEQLLLAAIFKQKELNMAEATNLAKLALQRDPGYSEAHQLLGILEFNQDHFQQAATEFQQAVDRNPYADESWYYLATSELQLGQQKQAERNFYFIWPNSSYYGAREYQLGRMYFLQHEDAAAAQHLAGAVNSNGQDINAHLLLALAERDRGNRDAALEQLATVEEIDPADRIVQAERYFLSADAAARERLIALMDAQSESAIEVSIFYSSLARWKEAAAVLQMVEPPHNKDPWGTPPVYYYTLAYDMKRSGDPQATAQYRKKAQTASAIVERFPYRAETEAPLADAVKQDPNDTVARFNLACLLYYRGRHAEAMEQWQAINQINPSDFSTRRALGLAYQEQGQLDKAIPQLQKAVEISPENANAMNDLSNLYARNGKFEQQVALLQQAIAKAPNDDDLYEGLLDAYLLEGKFQAAQDIIDHHTFGPRHRTYRLRDEYRELEYGKGSEAFNKGDYEQALALFQAALNPPANLGMDTFELQSTPRIYYYIGRTLDALGRKQEAKQAYQESIRGVDQLAGGGSDSWNPENFFMVLSLAQLGRQQQAAELLKQFRVFAEFRLDSPYRDRVARARYLLGLIDQYQGDSVQAHKQIQQSAQIEPDYIAPTFELRGDTIDPAAKN
jgi:tetratricopeptide (TPR) repeat protein